MKITRLLPVGMAATLLWGCGGGGGSSSSQNALVQGRAAMNELASGQKAANEQSLQQILDLFLQAIQLEPNSAEAHFGAAVCLAGQLAEEMDGQTTESIAPDSPPAAPGKPGLASSGGGGLVNPPQPPAPPSGRAATTRTATTVASEPNGSGEVTPVPPGKPEPAPLPPHRTLGLFWNLDNNLANPYMLLHMLAPISDLRLGFAPYYGYPHDNAARRQKMLDGLDAVTDHLTKVEADPSFSATLPDVDASGKTVTVGLPEVFMFDAYVQSLRAKVAMSLAYVRDSGGGWNPPVPAWDGVNGGSSAGSSGSGTAGGGSAGGFDGGGLPIGPFPSTLDKDKDGKLSPGEYLPPSPYLTLRDAKLLQTAQRAMVAVVDREKKGIEGVLARPANGSFLIPNVPDVQKVLTEIRDSVLPLIQQAATGPFTIEVPRWDPMPLPVEPGGPLMPLTAARGDKVFASPVIATMGNGGAASYPYRVVTETLKVNIAAWFTNPPPDLKAFAPTFTLGSDGWPDPSKTSYPDRTFGGLFPDGIKNDLPF